MTTWSRCSLDNGLVQWRVTQREHPDSSGLRIWVDSSVSDKSYTANQANAFATQNNIFQITGIQLEVGDISDPVFEHRSFGEELTCLLSGISRNTSVAGQQLISFEA